MKRSTSFTAETQTEPMPQPNFEHLSIRHQPLAAGSGPPRSPSTCCHHACASHQHSCLPHALCLPCNLTTSRMPYVFHALRSPTTRACVPCVPCTQVANYTLAMHGPHTKSHRLSHALCFPCTQVANYTLAMHGVAAEAAKERAGAAGKEFRASVATATARALGARYKPEIAAAVAALPKKTADGIAVDFALDNLKVGGLGQGVWGVSGHGFWGCQGRDLGRGVQGRVLGGVRAGVLCFGGGGSHML